MFVKRNICVLILIAVSMVSCISPKSYVDPQYRQAGYDDIKTVAKKYAAVVEIEFQRNGERYSRADNILRNHVEIALRATGVIVPSQPPADITLKVTANNIADLKSAAGKGFATGLTFGAVGSAVTDYYEFNVAIKNGNGETVTKVYKHAIHTTIGNKSAPVNGVEPTSAAVAFGKVVEDVILNFVKEMQSQNILTFSHPMNLFAIKKAPERSNIIVCRNPGLYIKDDR